MTPSSRRVNRDNRASGTRVIVALNVEELDVEDEHSCRRARPRGRVTVRERARNPEAHLVADFHELNALPPAFDDVTKIERRRCPARDGAVERLAVRFPPRVFYKHLVGSSR